MLPGGSDVIWQLIAGVTWKKDAADMDGIIVCRFVVNLCCVRFLLLFGSQLTSSQLQMR